MSNIVLIQGHPDHSQDHLGHALLRAYARGAESGGHSVRVITVAELDVPFLRSKQEFDHGKLPESLRPAQEDLAWCNHLVLFFPLWLGEAPAMLKAFLEQILRPGFAFKSDGKDAMGIKGLSGRSAHIICTMGMPAVIYRWYYWNHGIRSLNRNVLQFVGFKPVRETLIGLVENLKEPQVKAKLEELNRMGRDAR